MWKEIEHIYGGFVQDSILKFQSLLSGRIKMEWWSVQNIRSNSIALVFS